MRLVLAASIVAKEFGGGISAQDAAVLKRSTRIELAKVIRGQGLPKGTRLLKVYATSSSGARRVVHLLAVEDETLFLLFYRNKQDAVGKNISMSNPAFRKQLHRHLDQLNADLEAGRFEVWTDSL